MMDTLQVKNFIKTNDFLSDVSQEQKNKAKEGGRPFVIAKHELDVLLYRDDNTNQRLRNFSLDNHSEIKWHHRAILLDWTLEVCSELGLKRQTW